MNAINEVVIIDDNTEILDIYVQILNDIFNLKISCFERALEAIEYLKHTKPKLIICDYYMPNANGSSVVQFNQQNNKCPIVICSSGLREEYKDLNNFEQDHELNQYIQKPFEIEILIDLVREAIKK